MSTASLLTETALPLAKAAREIPGARGAAALNPSTVWRWCTKGTRTPDGRRVKLEYYRIGSRVMTTREALARYVNKLSERLGDDAAPPTRTPSERRKAQKRADAECEKMGA